MVVQGYILEQLGNFNIYMGGARQPEEHGIFFFVVEAIHFQHAREATAVVGGFIA